MEPTRTSFASRFARSLAAAPAVPLALAALAGTALGRGASFAPAGPLVVMALLAIALSVPRAGAGGGRGRPGAVLLRLAALSVALLAAGFLNGHLRGGAPALVPDRQRPVVAVVETTGHWRRLGEVWSAPVRVRSLRQGDRVVEGGGAAPVYLHVASPATTEGAEAPPGAYGARLRVKGFFDRPVRLGNPTPRPEAPPGPWLGPRNTTLS